MRFFPPSDVVNINIYYLTLYLCYLSIFYSGQGPTGATSKTISNNMALLSVKKNSEGIFKCRLSTSEQIVNLRESGR